MTEPYWFSDWTRSLPRHSDEWLTMAFADAYEEARLIAAELTSPNDVGYEDLVEKFYEDLCERLYQSVI